MNKNGNEREMKDNSLEVDDCLLKTIRCAKIMLNILLSQWIMCMNE